MEVLGRDPLDRSSGPDVGAPVARLASFSSWFERSVATAKVAICRVGVLLVGVWLLFGIAGWWLVVSMFDSDRGRELRRLLDIERSVFGGSTVAAELTDAEADRAWELAQDIFWSALPWMVLLGVGFVVLAAWSGALAARGATAHRRPGERRRTRRAIRPPRGRWSAPGACRGRFGDRRVPRVRTLWIVAWLPVALVAAIGGGGAAILLTVVFVVLLVVVATAWLWVRLALASVIAGAGGHGIGVTRLGAHPWAVLDAVGRLIVTGLIAGAAGGVINSVTGFGQFLGFVTYVGIVSVLQAVALAASIVVTVSGHLATVEQLLDRPEAG